MKKLKWSSEYTKRIDVLFKDSSWNKNILYNVCVRHRNGICTNHIKIHEGDVYGSDDSYAVMPNDENDVMRIDIYAVFEYVNENVCIKVDTLISPDNIDAPYLAVVQIITDNHELNYFQSIDEIESFLVEQLHSLEQLDN